MADHEYTGHVEPGGEPVARDLEHLQIRKLSVGSMDNNAYVLTCRSSGAQLLIDAAADPDALRRMIAAGSEHNAVDMVLTTHQHHDHVGALAPIVEATGARTAAGAADATAITEQTGVRIDEKLADGDVLRVGEVELEIIALRGHTPGSVAVLYRGGADGDHLFTGDSLFPGGVGKTSGPEDFAQLIDDVEQRIFDRLEDSTWVYPGHGDDTTLGAERGSLPAWRERGW